MDEAALRQIVREAVGRQLQQVAAAPPAAPTWKTHVSHGRLLVEPSQDGACIVEPAVRCTHCGYCQSMGH